MDNREKENNELNQEEMASVSGGNFLDDMADALEDKYYKAKCKLGYHDLVTDPQKELKYNVWDSWNYTREVRRCRRCGHVEYGAWTQFYKGEPLD